MAVSAIQPKRPKTSGWVPVPAWQQQKRHIELVCDFPSEAWLHRSSGIYVISSVEVAHDPGQPDLGPEYHLSMSRNGGRCTSGDALWVLSCFDVSDAKEDNHVPNGIARNWWRPVADNLSGYECPCQDEEPAMREDKGDYVWRGVTR
jgi:hypothetical protein